jgi:hypothetical protein
MNQMIVERKKGKFVITERTPSAKDFAPKALKLYRELIEFVKNNPKLRLLLPENAK